MSDHKWREANSNDPDWRRFTHSDDSCIIRIDISMRNRRTGFFVLTTIDVDNPDLGVTFSGHLDFEPTRQHMHAGGVRRIGFNRNHKPVTETGQSVDAEAWEILTERGAKSIIKTIDESGGF